jgi:adenine-specific DNA-methyltransferase
MSEMPEQPERLDLRSQDIAGDKVEELVRLFPEVRTEDGQIDFDRLRLTLGESVDVGKERYGLTWPGKAECFKTIQAPSLGTLLPAPEESINWDSTENLIIEGDNLEVLKLLQKAYLGKVKMIYIDPPYNTGNDFIYPDDFSESLRTYLEYTGQLDAEGRRFSTNTDTDGRFHSKWLNMMYPRLYLARNLLREDGVIFISIDDNEVRNLRAICDEIFGEQGFVAQISVQSNKGGQDYLPIAKTHEYLLCYAKGEDPADGIFGLERVSSTAFQDHLGPYEPRELRNRNPKFHRGNRPNLFYPYYVNPEITDTYGYAAVALERRPGYTIDALPRNREGVDSCWRWGKAKANAQIALDKPEESDVVARQTRNGGWNVYEKSRRSTSKAKTIWDETEVRTEAGTREVRELFGANVYDHPKPVALLSKSLRIGSLPDDVVLDFFAGSGTTAHAVLDLNKQDAGNRKFILVQLPEPTDRKDFATISEITKERVRRVIAKLNSEDDGKLGPGGAEAQDRGFRVFKLAESNIRPWQADVPHDAAALTKQLELHVEHIRDDRSADDLLYEILLKSGFPLTTPVESLTLAGTTVASIGDGLLLVCVDRDLSLELIRAMAERKPERVVLLDEGFTGNDQLKANAVQILKTAGVTSFKTV